MNEVYKIKETKQKIITLISDGELQEGSTWECLMMAANLNLDNLITTKPNAFDQDVLIKKDTATGIYMLKGDYDDNITSKTVTVTANPRNGSVGSWSTSAKTITYTPRAGFTGLDSFSFTVRDTTNTSEEKKVFITVN